MKLTNGVAGCLRPPTLFCQTNSVFAKLPTEMVKGMHDRGWKFYTHVAGADEARLMCSWDTTEQDVDGFAADLRELSPSS